MDGTRDPSGKNPNESIERLREASLGGLSSLTPHQMCRGLHGPPPQLKSAAPEAPYQSPVAPAADWAPLGPILSSCTAGSRAGSSSSHHPTARPWGLMLSIYLGTSLPEIAKLE